MFIENISLTTLFLTLVGLFFLSAFFSGSETALMSVNRYRIAHLAAQGDKAAQRVLKLLSYPDRLIGLILLGNNFVNILIAQIASYIGYRIYGDIGIAIATGVLTFLLLIFAELAPKTLGASHSKKISLIASLIYPTMLIITYPLVWFINLISNSLLTLLGVSKKTETIGSLNREELRAVLSASSQDISKTYQTMLSGILDLEQRTVEDIMIPHNEIQGIDLNLTRNEIEEQLLNSIYTRIPVYRNNINQTFGILHIRDFLPLMNETEFDNDKLLKIVREPFYIPERTNLLSALTNFQSKKRKVGLVVDEYGDINGLITLEDLLEEIVGEFTSDPATYDRQISIQQDGSVIVEGSCHIRDLNRATNWTLTETGPKTINGLILEHLETIPGTGIGLLIENHPVEVIKTQNNTVSIAKIGVKLQTTKQVT